jgi:fatty-acyl-CoA synthase
MWNYGDILDTLAECVPPDAPALIHGTRTITWSEFDRRTNNLARAMLQAGAQAGDKLAFYMRNSPAYSETLAAGFKARLTHVNINYRYTAEEVFYIIDNSDATVLVFDASFEPAISAIKHRLAKVILFIIVDGKGHGPYQDFEHLAQTGTGKPLGIQRSGNDELFIYTGGTTGMPKGVIWRHNDLREIQLIAARALGPVPETMDELRAGIKAMGPMGRLIPACPLMHGTGLLSALSVMMSGGTIITLTKPNLDPEEVWQAAATHRADRLAIVGDAFAKPMLKYLDDHPGRFDLSCVIIMVSSGVMWSTEVKRGLLAHLPQAVMTDSFGSSEGIGFGNSMMTIAGEVETARFTMGPRCTVFDEQDQPIIPGSGKPGIIAIREPVPVGYYKDPIKSAKTFRTIGGVRYSMPGDWCLVEADGTLTLLGRGSACINTAGEKVFPEEVEEILKTHEAVEDALVVGVPDDKWGQAVTAAIRLNPGYGFDEDVLRAHVRAHLASYKVPKRIFSADIAFRAPNGKADYKTVGQFVKAHLDAG